ncbi:rho GTPase-activating protein 28 isoform X2 [Syngnathus scovelli]|uniref:rho GTPase-activating protein 28 isoform X2 n=1 Tax=Syngnathus scovelli TaxID=161590 RepID=UPI00210F9B92|nr:rho GTPase-activating protein 28 isoform X3 [Syngnathus scovelli]
MMSSSTDQAVSADPQHITMETYWQELESMEEQEEDEEEERRSMDELELEEAWLNEAGLSSLLVGSSAEEAPPPARAPSPARALLATLTRQQTLTVRTRLRNYTHTLKNSHKQAIVHVKDIFAVSLSHANGVHALELTPWRQWLFFFPQPDFESVVSSVLQSDTSQSAQSCYDKNTTKTIRRHTKSAHPDLSSFCYDVRPSSPPASSKHPAATKSERARPADWLARDCPYSDGVAEHKRSGTCWDCLLDRGRDVPFVCPNQGMTQADDLSSADVKRLRFICHIELSTFLLALGVQSKRTRPARTRSGGALAGAVFAVPLNALLDNDRKKCPGLKIPLVFHKLLCVLQQTGLQTEGILRVSGSVARLKYLRRELDRCPEGFDWSAVRPVDAAGLLKLFIRELPTPLLTHAHLPTFRAVLGVSGSVHQVQALQLLSLLLPEAHRETLKALLVFLHQVVSHQEQNRMSLWNVATVMAPNLFTTHRRGSKERDGLEEAVGGTHLVRLMIMHQELLWTVPNFLLSQLRQMNQASNHKLGRLLRTRNDKNKKQVTELCEGIIKVYAPFHAKVSMAIQLDRQMTAQDVTAHFKCDSSVAQRLFEVGGNIGERRLHPDCLLLDVYRENPGCEWLVKP